MSPLKKFLQAIPTMGVPEKIRVKTLPQIGFKSSNARYIPSILKFIKFIDASGAPTEDYKNFRKKRMSKSVMANALKKAYADLFKLYPDAPSTDFGKLRDFFSGTTDAGESALKYTVETFKTLCSFADLEAVPPKPPDEEEEEKKQAAGLTINLNVQLTLPVTEDAKVYDAIFKALKENLLA